MKKTLLNISFSLLTVPLFAQVPPTPAQPTDSLFNDSLFFNNEMQEVVVIGYGTKKAGAITGSVSQVKAADIVRTPAQSAMQAIQGKAAGVNIVTNDEPGKNPVVRIRGLGNFNGGENPLYVIDGIETNGLNGLNPNDIATIDVLKDASSLAIYGQKGANGVILVTTKKGKQGAIKVAYDAYYGQKYIQQKVDMADSYRYAYYNNAALGSSSYFNFNQPYNTDWLDEITRTGEVISNNISLSGASDNASYYFGASNYKEKGILNGTEFERTNVISKTEFKLYEGKIKVTPFFNLSIDNTTPKPLSAFTNAYRQAPIMPVKYSNGRWAGPFINSLGFNDMSGARYNNVGNPVAQLHYYNEQNKNVTLIGAVNIEAQIIDFLKFNSNFGATGLWGKGYTYTPTRDLWLAANPTEEIADYIAQNPKNPIINTLQQRRNTSYRYNWDNYLTFNKTFAESHNVTVVAGMSKTSFQISEYLNATRLDVPEQSNYWSLNFSNNNINVAPGSIIDNITNTPIVSVAYFARLEYDYNGKYLLSASVRREGVSAFAEGKRHAVFPSVSGGWVVTSEDFMQGVGFIDNLKIRAGYGEVGNGYTGNALNVTTFGPGFNYPFGTGSAQTINPGTNIPRAVDPNLTWETMKEIDLGFDFAILSNKLTGTFDYYNRTNDNVILPVNVPPVLSPLPVPLNTGEVNNKGFELTLKWQDAIGADLTYWVGGNFSHNENELKKVYHPLFGDYTGGSLGNGQYTKNAIVGQPIGTFYVYDVTGYGSDGFFTYSENRVAAGSYLPTFTYGINLGTAYKGFDFSVDAYGAGGNELYNGKKAQRFGGENIESALLDDFWTPSTPNATNPRPSNEVPRASTYYIEKGDFLRINNITLGYTLPEIIKGVDKIRVYATALNPFLFTKYSGFSPEISGSGNGDPLGTAGIELDAYPTNKTFLFGLNVGF